MLAKAQNPTQTGSVTDEDLQGFDLDPDVDDGKLFISNENGQTSFDGQTIAKVLGQPASDQSICCHRSNEARL